MEMENVNVIKKKHESQLFFSSFLFLSKYYPFRQVQMCFFFSFLGLKKNKNSRL